MSLLRLLSLLFPMFPRVRPLLQRTPSLLPIAAKRIPGVGAGQARHFDAQQRCPTSLLRPPPQQWRSYRAQARFSDDAEYDADNDWNEKSPQQQNPITFKSGDRVMVEIVSFGPLGASVDVVAHHSHNPDDMIPASEPALATGLILQKEIYYFRQGRGGVDVLQGECLPAYVERTKLDETTGELKIDIGLREYGGRAKAGSISSQILQRLETSPNGVLDVGDKSPPGLISELFPGVSKSSFKKAVALLYKQGKVRPGPHSISLM